MKKVLIAVTILFIFALAITIQAATPKNGKFYFDALKKSMIMVIDENQGLINDGGSKSKKLTAQAILKKSLKQYKSLAKASEEEVATMTDFDQIGYALAALLSAGRITIAKSQKYINKEADGSIKKKKFIPAVFGLQVGKKMSEISGVVLKQTTIGKNGFGARNTYNKPDDWENTALKQFNAEDWEQNKGIGSKEGDSFRYIKPIYIKKGCLGCHGEVKGEKGPYGSSKEGYIVGDVRGGISVTIPLKN
ncbi:MAG: DUF3365 domain-containing protein [archaeon]|nr:DUF3365 domain-containing protein [archaeon]